MLYSEFYNKFKGNYRKKMFKNVHGEKFYIFKTKGSPSMVLITGEEYDWELVNLFNDKFNMYSDDELRKLGKTLQEFTRVDKPEDIK